MKRSYALLPLFLVHAFGVQAEHFAGGSITSTCTGNNFHDITMTLFLDCVGDAPGSQTLNLANSCGVVFNITNLPLISVDEVSPLCPDQVQNSQCNGGALPGMLRYTYRTNVYLSPCAAWTISWGICCRNTSLNLLGTPGMYLEERLNNFGGVCNTSPVPVAETIPFVCLGQSVTHDASAVEPEGNVLRYRLIDARYAAPDPTPVFYAADYNGAEPYTGLVIDSITGIITFQPTVQGNIITVVEVRELNEDGGELCRVMRDFLFMVRACANSVPSITSGTFSAVTGPASIVDPRELLVCTDGEFCASLAYTDSNLGEELTITTNLENNLPGATINLTGTNPVSAQICWNADGVTPGRYEFTVLAADNACPIPGSQVFSYAITISEPQGNPGTNAEVVYCSEATAFALVDSLGGQPDLNGSWQGPTGASSGIFIPGSSEPGTYTYTVTDPSGCSISAALVLVNLPAEDPSCITLGLGPLRNSDVRIRKDQAHEGRIWIEVGRAGTYDLALYAVDGRLVVGEQLLLNAGSPMAFDLGTTAFGVHLLRLEDRTNGTNRTERIFLP